MIYVHYCKSGNYEIPIPDGFSVVSSGNILEGDLYLVGGDEYNPEDYLIEFKPFSNLDLGTRSISPTMLIIRQDSL